MLPFEIPHSSGAPTFIATSASLSLSGPDHYAPATPDILDAAEWYHSQDPYHHPDMHAQSALSPAHEQLAADQAFALAFPNLPVSEAFDAPPYSPVTVDHPMNGYPYPSYHPEHGAPSVDDLTPLSPIQSTFSGNHYQTPYPDSTASSAPSEDPVIAEAEEDKRKRNQAASARFRQKKKQREQQMVEQSREMHEKNKKLAGEVEGLKRENTFLKKLLVEKVDNMSDEDKAMLVKTAASTAKELGEG